MRVLVVGAGPTGLTTAVELVRQGIDVQVIDKKNESSTLSRAVGIMPHSLKLLAPSGVTEKLLTEGVRIDQACIYRGTRLILTIPFKNLDPHDYSLLALPQDRTEAHLRDALMTLGGSIHYGTELTGLRQENGQVIVETAEGNESSFDYVVGADGVGSTTRKLLGVDFQGHDLSEKWSIADIDVNNWPHHNAFTMSILPKGEVAVLVPMEEKRYRIVSNTEDALATFPLKLDLIKIRRQGQFNISIRQVAHYAVRKVFLAGDAAHCHSPVGGRGMNLGIADGVEFAHRLVEGNLDGYDRARRQEGKKIIAGSEEIRKLVTSRNPLKRFLLLAALKSIGLVPVLQRMLAKGMLYS